MTTLPDVDTDTIEEITEIIPCAYVDARPPCSEPAHWISFWSCGCPQAFCDPHREAILKLGKTTGAFCENRNLYSITITHWEKL